jgi:hypothetical protein
MAPPPLSSVFRFVNFVATSSGFVEESDASRWYYACLWRTVPETAMGLVYDEPTVMWRMRRPDGLLAHAMIGPRPDGAVVVWFINDRPLGYRDFDDWTAALRWSDQMQAQNWAVGWRLVMD